MYNYNYINIIINYVFRKTLRKLKCSKYYLILSQMLLRYIYIYISTIHLPVHLSLPASIYLSIYLSIIL